VDDQAVAEGIWKDGAAVDTLSGSTTGRAIALIEDGAAPNEVNPAADAEDLDWQQYPAATGGTPGRPNDPNDPIFQDGFESGDLSAWTVASTDAGDLAVSATGALKGTTQGLAGLVDDQAGLYVEDGTPADEPRYRARFHFDTNDFDPGEASGARRTRILIAFEEAPMRRLAAVVLRRLGGAYAVMGRARLDDNSQSDTGFFPVSPGPHAVELQWRAASGPDALDGTFALWIDGVPAAVRTGLDNSRSAVDLVRLGALSVKAGASGTLLWDEFVSRRRSYIGP
jgi:hypothetical protein